jgi:predicted permease
MADYLKILGSVLPIFFLMALGVVMRRVRVLNEEADRSLLDLIVHLLAPCLILDNVVANEALRQAGNLLWSPLAGFAVTAASVLLARLVARGWGFADEATRRTFGFVGGIYNYGYLPVPLIAALYGARALAILFLFNLGTEVAFWTVGFASLKNHNPLRDMRRVLTMPVRALLLGVAINLGTAALGLRLDPATLATAAWGWPVQVVADTIHLAGLCSIPLSMLLIGATMADFWSEFRAAEGVGPVVLALAVRNLICPAGFILLACLLPVSRELKETLVVQGAMPAGVFSLLLVRHNGGSVPLALQIIFSTSGAAIITLPLWIRVGMQLIGPL